MKIAIAGAGAMGSRFGVMLHRTGTDVVLIDQWDQHIHNIQEKGLKVTENNTDTYYQIPIMKPQEVKQNFDVVILFTKTMQLDAMLQSIQHIINENTLVVTLLNGLGNLETMEKYMNKRNIIAGVTLWSSELHGPGHVELTGSGSLDLQLLQPDLHDTFEAFINALNKAQLHAKESSDVVMSIWKKAGFNCVLNTYCTILNCNVGQFGATKNAMILTSKVLDEFVAVAHAEGIMIKKEEVEATVKKVFDPAMSGDHFPSMVQDIHKKRKTEIDYLNGAVARIAQKHQIPTPTCSLLTELIHALEDVVGAA